ncbi:MAG: pyridoxamine 5'-phosphate oxidase family protein [Hydrogenophaga sp.]|nr:pyridoxamine 5'-phosphate oxidase family protein [Hydrogenophaga sp.]
MPPEHGLSRALRELLHSQRTAALGTLDADGAPFVSMVPFALRADGERPGLVLHVSALAPHTGNLQRHARVSLMVCRAEVAGEPVHALPRVSFDATARLLEPGSDEALACRRAYLQRFPEAEPMTQLGDFRFVRLDLLGARQVAGFGAARSLDAGELLRALTPPLSP